MALIYIVLIQIMQNQQPNLPTIKRILLQRFNASSNSDQFSKHTSSQVLEFVVLERIDKFYAYMTDGNSTILTVMHQKRDEINCYSLNKLQTPFYTCQEKSYLYLNFTQQYGLPSIGEIHPYNPHFYFREQNFNQFLAFRTNYTIKKPAEKFVITNWNLALVNISTSGYYGPVVVIQKYKKQFISNPPNYNDLNCILFESWLQKKLQDYRISDIRKIFGPKQSITQRASLFYYLRHQKRSNNFGKCSKLVSQDHDQHLLRFSTSQQRYPILIGDINGVCSFVNPTKKKTDFKKIQDNNLKNMLSLFNSVKISDAQIIPIHKKQALKIWSDSESDSEKPERPCIQMEQYSSSDDEDPLRNIYIKELRKKIQQR